MRALQYAAIPKGDLPTKQSMVVIKRYIHYRPALSYPSLASPPPEVVIIRYVCYSTAIVIVGEGRTPDTVTRWTRLCVLVPIQSIS